MNKELYVSSTPHETKVALTEDDQLAEVFFERENEYTLAGSIYKGRVTRVLPGMQSAFVDIGLERDAFLYVSDFLELTGDEDEEEEFGAIPAPRGAIDVGKPQPVQEAQSAEARNAFVEAEIEEEGDSFTEEASSQELSAGEGEEEGDSASGEEGTGEGARRWRGRRRRRGGRRGGRPEERENRPQTSQQTVSEAAAPVEDAPLPPLVESRPEPRRESRYESRPDSRSDSRSDSRPEGRSDSRSDSRHDSRQRSDSRSESGPPPGYTPIILPGESISKYRNLAPVAKTQPEAEHTPTAPVDDFAPMAINESSPEVAQEISDEATHLDQGFDIVEPEQWEVKPEAPAEVQSDVRPEGHSQTLTEGRSQVQSDSHTEAHAEAAVEPSAEVPVQVQEEVAPPVQERTSRGRWGSRRKQALAHAEVPAVIEQEPVAETTQPNQTQDQPTVPVELVATEASENAVSADVTNAAPATETSSADNASANAVASAPEVAETSSDVHEGHFSDAHLGDTQAEQEQRTELYVAEGRVGNDAEPESADEINGNVADDANGNVSHQPSQQVQLSAPSEAPAGRTLEHEVLDEEEMEFHPVPDDLSAMKEADGDEEMVLEEETLDAGAGYSDRWIPKIEEVDEDEVVAAEERGENIFGSEEEEEEDDNGLEEHGGEENGEEETNGRAELRATIPTAAYQRQAERPGYDRRPNRDRNDRDRGRRGGPRRNNVRGGSRANNTRNQPLISDLLKEGQEVLIQIAKEPLGKKGARITSHIALPGRFLVYMPTVNHVGVSRKIASDEERQRLKRIVTSERENGVGGFIVRTAAANIKEEDLRADIRFLKHLWAEIKTRAENSKSPALIYHDLNLVERVMRDQVNADFSQVWVDTEDMYERVVRFANRFQPSLVRRIKLYTKDTPLYEQFGIQDEINRSLKSKVWLKSGGHIVINQTEALVAIDVNTGKFVGKTQRLEDTIVKTNVDAIKEIVRQIRLRDLGGIIVIDFIDMDERKNRQKVMMALDEALRSDRAPSKVLQFNDFGLVAITRKRVKQSLERTLGESCPYCTGAGFVKSVPTICNELYIEMRKMAKIHDKDDITVRVHPEVTKALKANNGKLITELEELTGKTVLVKSDPALHQEMFDIH